MSGPDILQHEEYVMRLISGREYTRQQICVKLRRRGVSENDALAIVDRLENAGLIDDSRYAVLFASSRDEWGVARIRAELVRRGVPFEIAKSEVPLDEESDLHKALDLLEGWRDSATPEKIRGRLVRRGFSSGVVRRAMEQSGL